MKVNVTAQDMEQVGYVNQGKYFHGCCAQNNPHIPTLLNCNPTPIFRKTADEYRLICFLCGKPLSERRVLGKALAE